MKLAWIKVIDEQEAEGTLKDLYNEIIEKRGRVANILKVHSLNPQSMSAHMDLYLTLMYCSSPLSREEREMLAVCVSSLNNCKYCKTHHGDALNVYWKDEDKLEKFKRNWREVIHSDRQRAMLEYAEKLTKTPHKVSEEDIERLKKYFDDRGILDITLIVAYFNFVNRIALGLGVEVTDEERRGYKY